jgi:crossover junction endodeoxyribonuclease RusA
MIEFAVSMPPSVNNLFLNVPGRGRVRSGRYRAWQDENLWALKALKLGSVAGHVRVDYWLPVKNRQDIDNPLKALNDLLQSSGILANDKQIRQLWVDHANRTDVLVKVTAL